MTFKPLLMIYKSYLTSVGGFLWLDSKPLPDAMLTQIYDALWRHRATPTQEVN